MISTGKAVCTPPCHFLVLTASAGMLSSWNKLCFNTGYIEVSISMPGRPEAPGLWPGNAPDRLARTFY